MSSTNSVVHRVAEATKRSGPFLRGFSRGTPLVSRFGNQIAVNGRAANGAWSSQDSGRALLQKSNRNDLLVLNFKSLRVALLMLVVARPALSHVDLISISKATETSIHEPVDELDADDASACFSLGELDIAFRTHNNGEPNVGVVLTDPRGRRIGFDPLTKHAWQELPVAQGYIDCDVSDGVDACQGLIQICGAVSGAYQLEVIAQQNTIYNVNVVGRSKSVLDAGSVRFSRSESDLSNLPIHEGSREIVSLKYSRDPQENVTAQLQSQLEAQGHDRLYLKGAP